MKDFLDRSYNVDLLGGSRVSDQAWQNSFYVAISASAHAALGCVTACLEDFRGDLATISIPVLVIHGDQDRVLPYEATSRRLPALLKNARSTVIAGGPHAIIWTHADEVNQALLDFIGQWAGRTADRRTRRRAAADGRPDPAATCGSAVQMQTQTVRGYPAPDQRRVLGASEDVPDEGLTQEPSRADRSALVTAL